MWMVTVRISKSVCTCLGKDLQKVKEEGHKLTTCFCREIQPTGFGRYLGAPKQHR